MMDGNVRLFLLLSAVWLMPGCGHARSDEEFLDRVLPDRPPVVPVAGVVTVDGQPAKGILVELHDPEAEDGIEPRGFTDDSGAFQLTTYNTGDGAPPGEYTVTFTWRRKRSNGSLAGPDKLYNLFNDPQESNFKIYVDDQPLQELVFDLKVSRR